MFVNCCCCFLREDGSLCSLTVVVVVVVFVVAVKSRRKCLRKRFVFFHLLRKCSLILTLTTVMFIKVKSFNGHAVSNNSIQTLNDMYRQEQGQTMENV